MLLCAGLKSSGSTWLYNAIRQIASVRRSAPGGFRAAKRTVLSFYAEDVHTFPKRAATAETLIIKTHIPSPSLQFLVRFVHGPVFITVREPRDAIASLMQRFHHPFEVCLQEVAASAACLVRLTSTGKPLVLRFEKRFFDQERTISRLAKHLGIVPSPEQMLQIFRSLRPDAVTKQIARMRARGKFGLQPNPDSFDPATHWHPGHVGDGRIEKFDEILSARRQRAVLTETAEYCQIFGYPAGATRDRCSQKRRNRRKIR